MKNTLVILGFLLFNAASQEVYADARLVSEVQREADGSIKRSAKVLKEFQKEHPCPSTGNTTGACPGWIKDHVVPLACNGADSVENLQWQKESEALAKDKWERNVYCKISKQ